LSNAINQAGVSSDAGSPLNVIKSSNAMHFDISRSGLIETEYAKEGASKKQSPLTNYKHNTQISLIGANQSAFVPAVTTTNI
jgi:hypothetical protein